MLRAWKRSLLHAIAVCVPLFNRTRYAKIPSLMCALRARLYNWIPACAGMTCGSYAKR